MPAASETLPVLEQRLTKRLLAFERLDEAWPRGRTAIERAETGRQREDALSGIVALRDRFGRLVSRADFLGCCTDGNLAGITVSKFLGGSF